MTSEKARTWQFFVTFLDGLSEPFTDHSNKKTQKQLTSTRTIMIHDDLLLFTYIQKNTHRNLLRTNSILVVFWVCETLVLLSSKCFL